MKQTIIRSIGTNLIPVAQIELGDRRREDYGDIKKLAAGIKRIGLLHPIIVQRTNGDLNRYQVVVGGRRFKAFQLNREVEIPARLIETLTPDELHEIESEENDNRKDFTEHERRRTFAAAKRMVEDVKKAATVISTHCDEIKPKKGRHRSGRKPKQNAPKQAIADALGVSKTTVVKAEQHVETAERFPFMQGDSWLETHVLDANRLIQKLPESERANLNDLFALGRGSINSRQTLEILTNLIALPNGERNDIYRLSRSADSRDRDRAITRAAARPPMPDPRIAILKEARGRLLDAVELFPDEPIASEIKSAAEQLAIIRRKIQQLDKTGGHTQCLN